jgi:hypothetical protein
MATPERQQDPGEHGYGGVAEGADGTNESEHPLEDPASDPRDDDEREDEDGGR